jgi:hypothetical protein
MKFKPCRLDRNPDRIVVFGDDDTTMDLCHSPLNNSIGQNAYPIGICHNLLICFVLYALHLSLPAHRIVVVRSETPLPFALNDWIERPITCSGSFSVGWKYALTRCTAFYSSTCQGSCSVS